MKTMHKILITLGLVLLCFAGCESDVTGVKETDSSPVVNECSLRVTLGYGNPMVCEVFDDVDSFDMDSANCIIHYKEVDIFRENVKYINIVQ